MEKSFLQDYLKLLKFKSLISPEPSVSGCQFSLGDVVIQKRIFDVAK